MSVATREIHRNLPHRVPLPIDKAMDGRENAQSKSACIYVK